MSAPLLTAVVLLLTVMCGGESAAGQEPDIDTLIAKGTELASPQVRRADLAIPYFKRALASAEQTSDPARAALAAARLGAAYRSTHQVAEGLAILQRGVTLAHQAGRPELEGLCLRTIANIHIEAGDSAIATTYLERALDIANRTNDITLKIATLNALSASARHQGRLTEATAHAREALQLVDSQLAAGQKLDSQPLFAVPFNLGKALADGGDYAAALEYFERAFAAAEAGHMVAGVWHTLFDTAEWYQNQGDLDRANAYYLRALEQSRKAESHDMEADTIRGLASIAEERGEFADAVAGYSSALAMYEQYGFGARVPSTMAVLARAQRRAGDPQRADSILRAAIARTRADSNPVDLARVLMEVAATARDHGALASAGRAYSEARTLASENGLRPTEAAAVAGLARLAQDEGELESALSLYHQAEALIAHLQARIPSPEQRAMFRETVHATFAGEFELLMRLARHDPAAGYARQAFETVERERAQDLTGALADSRLGGNDPRAPATHDRQLHIGQRLAEIQTELMSDDVPGERRRVLRAEQDDREREWDAAVAASTDERENESIERPPSSLIEDVQRSLLPGEALLEYTATSVFVVTRATLQSAELSRPEGLAPRVDFFVRLLAGDDPQEAPASGRLLFATLLAPVFAIVPPGTSRLIVSATGALASLPFAALPNPFDDGAPLIARYEIAYTTSAQGLVRARRHQRASAHGAVLAVANPEALGSRAQLVTASLTRTGTFGPLAYANEEVQRIARYAPDGSDLLVGRAATEDALKHLDLSNFDVLHFATHAVLDPVAPMRSAIVLGAGHGEDGLLQAREIFQLHLSADLVVLSACRTAAGRPSSAEGMQSLARAFIYAGARSVVGTLWDVDDRSTATLMDRFYHAASRGLPIAQALRQAQLDVMGSKPYASAPSWAAFLITGDPAARASALSQRRGAPDPMWVIIATTLALAIALVISRRRHRSRRVMAS